MKNIVFSKDCLQYGNGHIEDAKRVEEALSLLEGFSFLEPQDATEEDVLLVHDREYVEKVKKGLIEDNDTPAYKGIYQHALDSVGGAITAASTGGFSLMRPPGHHVGKSGAALGAPTKGFCYFNSIAVAVSKLGKNTLVLDIDGHHGNGTQEIFAEKKGIVFISLHRRFIYPGTGLYSEKNCFNFPLFAECGEDAYLQVLDEALRGVSLEDVEVVAVSAGFDAYAGDIASLGLKDSTYYEIGKRIRLLEKETFFVLEGGYIGVNVGRGVKNILKGFGSI